MKERWHELISEVEEKKYNRIQEVVKGIGASEKHFNDLSSKYKMTASTWLLSMFAGIGFVMANKVEPTHLLIAGICAAGSFGIYLLWLIDLKVYQQLLSSNFVVGYQLEKKYKWLPPIRQNMVASMKRGSAISNLSWFYIIGIVMPYLIGFYAFSKHLINWSFWFTIAFAIIFSAGCVFITVKISAKSEEGNLRVYLKKRKISKSKFVAILIAYGLIVFLGSMFVNFSSISAQLKLNDFNRMDTNLLKEEYDYLAPDGSEIRLLTGNRYGGLAHCVLPSGEVSKAVKHQTVEEIWYVLQGEGQIWRKHGIREEIVDLQAGLSLTIPVGTSFQFKNTGNDSLTIIIATMPPWPGAKEAKEVEGKW